MFVWYAAPEVWQTTWYASGREPPVSHIGLEAQRALLVLPDIELWVLWDSAGLGKTKHV